MIKIIDCDQNSDVWLRARLGIVTASNFATVMASGKGGGDSITRRKYMYQLAGETVTGEPAETYSNASMARGHAMEDELRDYYAFLKDADPERVGFIRNGNKGCSPDSLVGSSGMLEVKSHAPHILIDLIFKDQFPASHKAQTQGQAWVAEREWVDIICGYSGMPPLIKRAYRDEPYIRNLSAAVDQFNEELIGVVERIKRYAPLSNEVANAA